MTIYISIGCECSPRIYIKHKLNITNHNGYKTCPFDLCITPFQSLYNCIKTDFEFFFDNLHTIPCGSNADGDRSKCGDGLLNITNYYGIVFNHEGSTHSHLFKEGKNDDDFYIRDDFKKFRERYSARIKNFLNYIEENNEITFIHRLHPGICEKIDIDKLSELFSKKYPTKIFNFIAI
jgi:hypothetical protein